jgi:surface protein
MGQNCATTQGCAVENTWGPIEDWCTGYVTDMSDVFNGNDNLAFETFDEDISGWNVSSAQTFFRMFRKAKIFQADLSGWDVSNAVNLEQMFRSAELFNADVSSWDLSSATSFSGTFRLAKAFDQDLTPWAAYFAPGVGDFKDMFRGSGIGQNLCSWDGTFPYGANVDSMFLGANNCQNQTSPVQEVGGPFCANCGE